ncbi:MAG: hypothetical protein ACRYG2_03380, partial [Janthinobacterium lividum]
MSSFAWGVPAPARWSAKWGHQGARILIGAIVAAIAIVVMPPPPGSAAALLLPGGLFAFVLASGYLMRQHDRRLCEDCMRAMPLDASATSARLRNRFSIAHQFSRRRVVVGYLVGLIASNVLLLGDGRLEVPGRWAWAACQSTMIYLVLAYSTHRRLQPWCPFCRGRGGDDDR